MINLDVEKWNTFKIEEIFTIYTGGDLILRDVTIGEIPVISHTEKNNGIGEYVDYISGRKLFDSNKTISLADRGLFKATVQLEDFYIGTRVKALELKTNHSNKNILKFIATMINVENFRFNYGRNSTDRLPKLKIKLPTKLNENNELEPDWNYMEYFIKNLEIKSIEKVSKFKNTFPKYNLSKLNINKWKEFKITEIFDKIESTKGNKTYELEDGNDLIYIAAKKTNNGAQQYTSYNENIISKGNCIVFVNIGDGAAGYSTYQSDDFIGMKGKTTCGYSSKLNKYNALFLVTILDKHRYKYCYGRSWTSSRLNNTKIQLPAKLNNKNKYEPDWEYMENYIKSLPYGDLI